MGKIKKIHEPDSGALTMPMDSNSREFNEFQFILLKKAKERNEKQKREITMLALTVQMEDYINSESDRIISVGYFLKLFLKSLRISQKRFAKYIGIKPPNLSKIISGERSVSPELALVFGSIFKHDPMLWIEIQSKNTLISLKNAQGEKYSGYSLNDLIAS